MKPRKIEKVSQPLKIKGDLLPLLGEVVPAEDLTIEKVTIEGAFMESDVLSPIVLIGDSHTLVFSQELLADHAGLPDLLCAELGMRIDVAGVQGSGANGSRIALARRKDNLSGKKCVVWCFSAREFTESANGWLHVPVIR